MISGEGRGGSGAVLLEKADILKIVCGLSLDPALVRELGGGGKTGLEPGSGEDRYIFAGGARDAGDIPGVGSSAAISDARWLRGGE